MPTRVQFDIGLEDNLPTLGMAENGHLYLSKDDGNMYLGLPNGSLLPLNRSPYFGKCTTAASTNSKVVSLDVEDSNFYLKSGVMISVRFNNENTASSPTLNVNNTGAIAIKSFGTTAIGSTPNTSWHSGEVISFIYDGNYWMKVGFDISGKADKVSNATNGNFAGLDSTGNLTDSGHNSDELVPSGGTIGQILAKHSNTDNDVEWITPEDTEISVSITYNNLVTLKTGGNLVPGMQYRITDYNTAISEDLTDVSVAEHQFDVIVTALSETELDHRASAIQHEGDTYFSDCDLSKWQLWYDIENDTEKYEWALDGSSSSNGGAKGSIPEYAPEYIRSNNISSLLNKANLSTVLVFQGIETMIFKDTDIECYVYGTSVQAAALGYEKLFLQEFPLVSSSSIYGIDDKKTINSISTVDDVSSSTQPTNGTKIIAKSITSDTIAGLLNKAGISPELGFNGRIVVYKGQNCYSYGSSAQYTALANDFKNVSDIIVEDGVSPVAPKKIPAPGTNVIILNDETTDSITTVSQETIVVGGNSGGTGVIYRMIDEWGNECPYDFKNIMFTDNGTNYYTFDVLVDSVHYDFSVAQTSKNCYGNTIKSSINKFGSSNKYFLSRDVFKNTELSSACISNIFGNNCHNNIFGNNCHNNIFGNNCYNNIFGNYCQYNLFRNRCYNNTFGNDLNNNSFGNYCYSNSIGNYCIRNTFGNYYYTNTLENYCQNITVFDGVQYCNVTGGTQQAPVKNVQILNGTKGASDANKLTITFTANQNYTQVAGLVNGTTLRIWIAEDTVTGPASSTDGNIAVFDGTSGKIVKDGGVAISDLVNVQSDWEVNDNTDPAYIDNKPSFNGVTLKANDWDTALYNLPVITHDVPKMYTDYTGIGGLIDSTPAWTNTGFHIEIPITPGLVGIEITGTSTSGSETKYAFLVEDQLQSGQTEPPIPTTITAGDTVRVSVPYGKDYIYIQTNNGTYNTRPTSIKLIMLNLDDSGYVHIAGSETITGQKTFTSDVVLWNGSQASSDPTPYLEFRKGTSDDNKYPDWKIRGDGIDELTFYSSLRGLDTKQVKFSAEGLVTITGGRPTNTSLQIDNGNVVVSRGSISVSSGSIYAYLDVTADRDITATHGDIKATAGNIIAGGTGRFKGLMYDSNSGTSTGHYIMSYANHSLVDSTNGSTYQAEDTMPVTAANVVHYVDNAVGNIPSPTTYYWANQSVQSSRSYATSPEFQQVTINGDSTATQASTDHCVIVYDTVNKCLKFTF